jgi:cytochrome oxidase assembly protein ShyY1
VKRRVALSLLGLCLVLAFASLGRWQLGREQIKREQLATAAAALAGEPQSLAALAGLADTAPAKVAGTGDFLATPRLWLDNQRRGPQVGVRLYCVFQPEAGPALLVDLGWLPLRADRVLPEAQCPRGPHAIAGLLVPPPSTGLRLGEGLVAQDDGGDWLATRIEPAEVTQAWSLNAPLAPRVLRLDPALPLGHERDLELLANTLPPEKHRGYAIQWFGLAIAMLAILLILNLRRKP